MSTRCSARCCSIARHWLRRYARSQALSSWPHQLHTIHTTPTTGVAASPTVAQRDHTPIHLGPPAVRPPALAMSGALGCTHRAAATTQHTQASLRDDQDDADEEPASRIDQPQAVRWRQLLVVLHLHNPLPTTVPTTCDHGCTRVVVCAGRVLQAGDHGVAVVSLFDHDVQQRHGCGEDSVVFVQRLQYRNCTAHQLHISRNPRPGCPW